MNSQEFKLLFQTANFLTIEETNELLCSFEAVEKERDALELVGQEPVAVVGRDYILLWCGGGPIAPIVEKHGLSIGSKLYAKPVPAPKREKQEPDSWRITSIGFHGTHTTDKEMADFYIARGEGYPLYRGDNI